jgi:hypothetical protein
MRHIWATIIYVGFFTLIGFAIWKSNSLVPLWALLFMPSLSSGKVKE